MQRDLLFQGQDPLFEAVVVEFFAKMTVQEWVISNGINSPVLIKNTWINNTIMELINFSENKNVHW